MQFVRKYNPFKRSVVAGADSPTSAASFAVVTPPTRGRQSTAASTPPASAGKRSKAEKELQHLSCKIVSYETGITDLLLVVYAFKDILEFL